MILPGLLPTPKKEQTFSFGATFGYPDPKTLPKQFLVGDPIEIKNQNIPTPSYICVPVSGSSVSEPQEGEALEPAYGVKVITEILGSMRWINSGTSLKVGAKAMLKGLLTRKDSPFSVEEKGVAFVANPDNWNKKYDDMALLHAKIAFFWIGTSKKTLKKMPMFDAIRSAMYAFRSEKRAVQTGVMWQGRWTYTTYIDKKDIPSGGHAFAIIGWKERLDKKYLIIQNSAGKTTGDNGLQYISEEIVNETFTFGALMYADMPEGWSKDDIIFNSRLYRAGFLKKILLYIIKFFKK